MRYAAGGGRVRKAPAGLPPVGMSPGCTSLVRTSLVRTPPVRTSLVRTPPVRTPPVCTSPVRTSPVRTPPVRTSPVRTPPVRTSPARTSPVRPEPVEGCEGSERTTTPSAHHPFALRYRRVRVQRAAQHWRGDVRDGCDRPPCRDCARQRTHFLCFAKESKQRKATPETEPLAAQGVRCGARGPGARPQTRPAGSNMGPGRLRRDPRPAALLTSAYGEAPRLASHRLWWLDTSRCQPSQPSHSPCRQALPC